MMDKKEELIQYMDSCIKYDIPINRFTYLIFRHTNGYTIRDLFSSVKRVICNIKSNIEFDIAFKMHP